MAFLPSIFGRKEKLKQIPRFTPTQQGALDQLLQGSLTGLQSMLRPVQSQFDFAPIAQQARSQFAQQTVPSLAERFTGFTGGGLSSPAFASQLGAAGAGLEEGLAALQAQFGLALEQMSQRERGMQLQALLSLLGTSLQPQFDLLQRAAQPGLWGNFLAGVGQGLYQQGAQLPGLGVNRLQQLLGF